MADSHGLHHASIVRVHHPHFVPGLAHHVQPAPIVRQHHLPRRQVLRLVRVRFRPGKACQHQRRQSHGHDERHSYYLRPARHFELDRSLHPALLSTNHYFGSSTVTMRSTVRFSTTCSLPLGHFTVSLSTFVAAPSPKCRRPSSCDRYPEPATRSAMCFLPPAVNSSLAPMPSRLLFVPLS